ncbi:MAG: hypothetical protein RLP15_04610 [Cryomorphaceae bacterium]
MSKDFTLKIYDELLEAWASKGYTFYTMHDYLLSPPTSGASVILRHDVDRKPENALRMAELQASKGIRGTYYFRIVPESFQSKYIQDIADLGHEIGYHYEDVTLCRGDLDKAIEHFERTLETFRAIVPITTICMHGSPMTKWDNRDVWAKYNYKDYEILGEPYFDVDFKDVYYLTDTGRRWDGHAMSVRDHVARSFDFLVTTTRELIQAVEVETAPKSIMQNVHPERWTDQPFEWFQELAKSSIKNPVKRMIKVVRP